ncbi:ABC transporter ATP-binding protein [Geobacillus thermodenitrificans]|jgi:putative ABC transport system ATP-binding protein|uniref:Putative hemin import ATP-binding protein HrtA n=1 Tax=Geobacillus thermodenitrificans TaxID=33940 RepID=A0ABY9QFN1_GEOTD|nr:ABC transporter ATP-binding protein [Geobacillus thermodenitrificans]ARA96874.1 hemin ABC transporter ATP-binding protein [Geobacillus thermodenitrificans]ATO36145.1 hemin ABC transporter ATP-binding protein [Geobacillus thermodenitrificans]PTR48122.1 ABC transporter ATP-binding protein [Geobacillus thermodenitrificans]WMV77725.1 ABC transporter ATP-binding protein [Geobacillus thermodenitrificans]
MSVIQFKNVSKLYQQGENQVLALDNVSLTVEQGEFIAVIGPSGSGKSTFLAIAGALLHATKGEVIINGKSLNELKPKDLAQLRLKEIGFILQNSNLVPYLNVLEQLLVVKRMSGKLVKEDKEFAKELLQSLGLAAKMEKLPEQLSGGERQRVAIARAFINNPSIILADEPTASLDSKNAHEVVQLIAKETKTRNKAAIMVTHDERMLEYCDKVYKMEDGKLKRDDSFRS